MKLNKEERRVLVRHFVHSFKSGRVVTRSIGTNATQVTHHTLCSLERKKLIAFEGDVALGALFGVPCFKVELTDAGHREVVRLVCAPFWQTSHDHFQKSACEHEEASP